MMEGQGGAVENLSAKPGIKPPESRGSVAAEQIKKSDVEPSGIYNLPAKVAGMEKKLGEISGNEHLSPKAFLKKIRRLNNRTLWLHKNLELNNQTYEAKFGGEDIGKVRLGLEDLPGKIKTADRVKASKIMMKNVRRLSEMGYSQ